MWDFFNFIVKFIIESGGIWGFLFILSICWVFFREWTILKDNKNKKIEDSENVFIKETKVIKEKQEDQVKVLDRHDGQLEEISEKLKEINSNIEIFSKITKRDNEKIELLTIQLQDVNDERIDELKEILVKYNKAMNEFTITLESVKFAIKTRLEED